MEVGYRLLVLQSRVDGVISEVAGLLEQAAVHVDRRLDRLVPQAPLDLGQRDAGRDQPGSVGVAQVVEARRLGEPVAPGECDGPLPAVLVEVRLVDRAAPDAGEQQVGAGPAADDARQRATDRYADPDFASADLGLGTPK